MRQTCPDCQREIKRARGKKYLSGDFKREKFRTAYSEIYRYECVGRKGCRLIFFVRYDRPVDIRLECNVSLLTDQALWNNALKSKPGMAQMRTTVGEFTDEIHRDPATNWQKVLRYFELKPLKTA